MLFTLKCKVCNEEDEDLAPSQKIACLAVILLLFYRIILI